MGAAGNATGAASGVGAGLRHRRGLELPLLPAGGLEIFVAVACLIGVTEELVYRGWLQGRLRALGWPVAVVAAAAPHAAYKSALFAWPPGPAEVDCAVIAGWTFVGGVVSGLLRQFPAAWCLRWWPTQRSTSWFTAPWPAPPGGCGAEA